MVTVVWLVVAFLATVVLTAWVSFTLARLDRLHGRVTAAESALDAQLVRRAAALRHVLEHSVSDASPAHHALVRDALEPPADRLGMARRDTENALGRLVRDVVRTAPALPTRDADELRECAERVLIARRFYNDAVRDTRTLRGQALPRLARSIGLRAACQPLPRFFDIDDARPEPTPAGVTPAVAHTTEGENV